MKTPEITFEVEIRTRPQDPAVRDRMAFYARRRRLAFMEYALQRHAADTPTTTGDAPAPAQLGGNFQPTTQGEQTWN